MLIKYMMNQKLPSTSKLILVNIRCTMWKFLC